MMDKEKEYHKIANVALTQRDFFYYCKINEYMKTYISNYDPQKMKHIKENIYDLTFDYLFWCHAFARALKEDGRFQSFIVGKFDVIDEEIGGYWTAEKIIAMTDIIVNESYQDWAVDCAGI